MSFGKDNQEGPPLGPPFHSNPQERPRRNNEDDDGPQFSPSFEPLLVDSPYYVKERTRPFTVGSEDVGPLPGLPGQGNGGMMVGPDHPGFWRPSRQRPPMPAAPTVLPPYDPNDKRRSLIDFLFVGGLSRPEPDSIRSRPWRPVLMILIKYGLVVSPTRMLSR